MNSKDSKQKKSFIPTRHSPLASPTLRNSLQRESDNTFEDSHLSHYSFTSNGTNQPLRNINVNPRPESRKHNDGDVLPSILSDTQSTSLSSECGENLTPQDNFGLNPFSYENLQTQNDSSFDNETREEGDLPVTSNLAETLQKCLFPGSAPKSFYSAIISNIKLVTHHPQQYIIRFGEPSKSLYILLKGVVSATSPDGETVHAELQPGAYFGEIGVLYSRPRTATVIAKSKTLLAVVTKETLDTILPNYPHIERLIRDEAQKRLSMQDNKRSKRLSAKLNLTPLLPSANGKVFANERERKKSIILPNIMKTTSSYSVNVSNTNMQNNNLQRDTVRKDTVTNDSKHKDNSAQLVGPDSSQVTLTDLFIPARRFLSRLELINIVPVNVLIDHTINNASVINLKPNEYVFRKGDIGTDLYFIMEGEVEIVDWIEIYFERSELHGTKFEKVLAKLDKYKYFGEFSFIEHIRNPSSQETKYRSADVRAVTSVKLLRFPFDKNKELCENYPEIFSKVEKVAKERALENKTVIERHKSNPHINQKELKQRREVNETGKPNENLPVSLSNFSETDDKLNDNFNNEHNDKLNDFSFPAKVSNSFSSTNGSSIQWNSNFLNNNGSGIYSSHSKTNSDASSNSISVFSTTDSASKRRSSIATVFSDTTSGFSPSAKVQHMDRGYIGSNNNSNSYNDNAESRKRRRSAFELRSMKASNVFHKPAVDRRGSVNLTMPSLNPLTPSLSNFPGQSYLPRHQPFQYVPHSKRIKYSHLDNGNNSRRRSSLLSYSPSLPDNLLIEIFKFLDLKTLMKLRRINHRWRKILYLTPELFKSLDLSIYHTAITDKFLISIADFVGPRVKVLNISNCYHITDKGFSYLVNEIGINGSLKVLKMRSAWSVSAMAIMDVASPSVGGVLEEIDLSNCKRVRDEVIERLVGNNTPPQHQHQPLIAENDTFSMFSPNYLRESYHLQQSFGCLNLKKLNLSYCKYLTDKTMYYIANHMNDRLEYLNLKRCTTITDQGFTFWLYKRFPRLKTLILSECTFLTQRSISALTFSAGLLENLDLSFCCALDEPSIDMLRVGFPYLKKLNLSFCGNAVSDASLLSVSLSFVNLEVLILKGCIRVTRAGVDILLSGCCPLKKLDISQCKYAHVYPGGVEAVKLPTKAGTRSSFITTAPEKGIVEIVL